MLSNRQTELLKIIVETYIKDVKPIGSKSICQKEYQVKKGIDIM